MLSAFNTGLMTDLRVMRRNKAQWFNPIVFFIIFITLFGIGLGSTPKQLIQASPAIIWIGFLLISLFTIESLFRTEKEEGMLEQLILSPYPLWWMLTSKSLAIWVASCLPLIVVIPIISLLLQLTLVQMILLTLSLLIGSPALTFVGVVGAALTITLPRSGVFLGLLLLPLYVPILILGESAVVSLLSDNLPVFQFALLGAISVLAMTFAPHLAAGALKTSMDD